MTDTITIPRFVLERLLSEMERTNAKTLAQFGVGMIDLNAIAALRSALEQPQEDPDLLAAYLYGFEKGKEQERPKCKQCGDTLASTFTALCYGCQQEGMQ